MNLFSTLVQTRHDIVAPVLRLTLGLVMFPHGAQKMIGWFGGPGLAGTIEGMQTHMGIPPVVTVLVAIGELFGSMALVAGFLTRFSATAVGVIMLGAVALAHAQFGFFMNWTGAQAGEGFEYHLLAIGLAVALAIRGGGAWSVDLFLTGRARHADRQQPSPGETAR